MNLTEILDESDFVENPRLLVEIQRWEQELFDRNWYQRSLNHIYRLEDAKDSQGLARLIKVAGPPMKMSESVLGAITVPGILVIALIIIAVVMRGRDLQRRDPQRRFTRQHRREGMARAQGQREMEDVFRRRCSRPAEHGDHFYPWSRGGPTSLQNFVAACTRCNRAKGARIPSPGQQRRMERRRDGDVALEEGALVGERRELS
jgi:hypothetical protein